MQVSTVAVGDIEQSSLSVAIAGKSLSSVVHPLCWDAFLTFLFYLASFVEVLSCVVGRSEGRAIEVVEH